MSNEVKEIYIVLTYTGTILSKIIKMYTGASLSHVSISLDKDLNEMYSFGRLNPYNPFIGGFIHESLTTGTFKRFKKTYAEIYTLKVSNKQYELIKNKINEISNSRKKYKFNTLGLFANAIKVKIKRDNYFYCAEFVKYLLEYSNVKISLPNIIQPIHFKGKKELKLVYKGIFRKYKDYTDNKISDLKWLIESSEDNV